ncbi:LuxR family maltose regulon positive regulatory protein [Paenibacillus harenae]|nr:LuxR family maltose regulon positive regulatory protein [Paenibacillus harenae]
MPIISTKLYIPRPRPVTVRRSRLIEGLNGGLHRKLTLVSASTGFGKTTLLSEWLAGCDRPAAWLSLDEGDNDPSRFLTYLIAAWQSIGNGIGEGALTLLQSPQPPIDSVLAVVLSDVAAANINAILVLDDYHVIEASPIHEAIALLIERMPPHVHLVIATRHDPPISLGRLRSRDQLNELRAAELRFTYTEVADFLYQVMNFDLSPDDVALLETRTEGWIAGLQLAAISMQGHHDTSGFIQSFSGSNRFVLDYLIEEVLLGQSDDVQRFLIQTSILDRLFGPLCDAVVGDRVSGTGTGQRTLEYLERANLFLVPLDNERLWYRYHHLFADLLRQTLGQHENVVSHAGGAVSSANELNLRASIWYEENGLEIEAFRYAAAAEEHMRAARLLEGGGMPLIFRGAVTPALRWLESLSKPLLQEMPSLLVLHASALLMVGQLNGAEQKLQAAEAALRETTLDDKTRDVIGHIASIRATIAVSRHQMDSIIAESRFALEYLHPDNLPVRTATTWSLGYAYQLQGDRAAARKAYIEAIAISKRIGHFIIQVMATIGLGGLQEQDNQLELAADTYRSVLELVGDTPMPASCEAHLGLARINCEWNDIAAAEPHLRQSFLLASQIENTDRYVVCELLQARLLLARGEVSEAAAAIA